MRQKATGSQKSRSEPTEEEYDRFQPESEEEDEPVENQHRSAFTSRAVYHVDSDVSEPSSAFKLRRARDPKPIQHIGEQTSASSDHSRYISTNPTLASSPTITSSIRLGSSPTPILRRQLKDPRHSEVPLNSLQYSQADSEPFSQHTLAQHSPSRLSTRSGQKRPWSSQLESPSSEQNLSSPEPTSLYKKPRFRTNQPPQGGPKISHYETGVSKLILRAIRGFEVRIWTENPFPEADVQVRVAQEEWSKVCKDAQQLYELPDAILSLIRERASHARGALRDVVRPRIAEVYGFLDEATKRAIRKNRETYIFLTDDSEGDPRFHYKDINQFVGFAENKLIGTIIKEAWFRTKKDVGVCFEASFCPISLVTIALILTVIECCLDEWADGTHCKIPFSEKLYRDKFDIHLKRINEWNQVNTVVIEKIRRRMYERARRASGAEPVPKVSGLSASAIVRAKEQLASRTGDTDSEASDTE